MTFSTTYGMCQCKERKRSCALGLLLDWPDGLFFATRQVFMNSLRLRGPHHLPELRGREAAQGAEIAEMTQELPGCLLAHPRDLQQIASQSAAGAPSAMESDGKAM